MAVLWPAEAKKGGKCWFQNLQEAEGSRWELRERLLMAASPLLPWIHLCWDTWGHSCSFRELYGLICRHTPTSHLPCQVQGSCAGESLPPSLPQGLDASSWDQGCS